MSTDKQRKKERLQEVQANLGNLFKSVRIVEPCLNQIVSLSIFLPITLPLDLGVIPTYNLYAGTYQYFIFCFKQCRNYLTSFPSVPYQYLESQGTDLPAFPAQKAFSSKCLGNIYKQLFTNTFLEPSCIFRAKLDVKDIQSCPCSQIQNITCLLQSCFLRKVLMSQTKKEWLV